MEFENGFGIHKLQDHLAEEYPEGKVPVFVKFIEPTVFRKQVQQGMHWKDPAVPYGHGEFTHRIQWYLICHCLPDHNSKWVETFKRIGQIVHPNNTDLGLWDALVDRTDDTIYKVEKGGFDCRSPETMTSLIVGDFGNSNCSFLHWFVKSRLEKRKPQMINSFWGGNSFVTSQLKKLGYKDDEVDAKADKILGKFIRRKGFSGEGIIRPSDELRDRK